MPRETRRNRYAADPQICIPDDETTALGTILLALPVAAQTALADLPVIGHPTNGAMGWQPAVTELARDIHWLDGLLLWIIGAITLFVTALMAWCVIRFNAKSNPKPATFTHNSPLEVTWTVVPIVILVFITAFSLPVLFKQQEIPEGDIVIKVIGRQWYWDYEYVDDGIAFSSYMIGQPATLQGAPESTREYVLNDAMEEVLASYGYDREAWLLATDTSVVVPVGATVVMQVTGGDVIHSFTIPAFGIKQDAIPNRTAELWFEAEQEGIYFGQCSELCGMFHAYMPITVKVVSQEVYDDWLLTMQGDAAPAAW